MWRGGAQYRRDRGPAMPLDIKVRWKPNLFLLVLASCLAGVAGTGGPKCSKVPTSQVSQQTRGDHGFYVTVAGAPRLYRPGQVYTVTLAGKRDDEAKKVKFINFMIVAESDLPSTDVMGLGTFQLLPGDAMSKFSHRCSHAVMATSALNKEEVSVLWTAPQVGSGCIMLKAMVVERNDFWFMDDGGLTYTICEDDSPMATPPVVEPCKACDEAKYEVIFEGLWSRHTHPKDFPRDEWQTQFSHMIGASHSIDYDLWKYGETSTPALSMLAETGETKKLEIDMKRHSQDIRSVIKARGLQQRSNVVGRTFAVFRMDASKHLLSLVSKLIPSPDWIVGVSMENLCLANGSWVDSRTVDLYPWDAGTNSGLGYHDVGDETMPREAIHRITSCNPDHEASPFFDPTCAPVKPVARLHILKQREYKKQCSGGLGMDPLPLNPSWGSSSGPGMDRGVYSGPGIGPGSTDDDNQDYDDYGGYRRDGQVRASRPSSSSPRGAGHSSAGDSSRCDTTSWTRWTACSQTCDTGSQSRSRSYPNPTGAQIGNCKKKLFDKRKCGGQTKCREKSYGGNFDPFFSTDELSGYTSPWSNRGLSSHSLKTVPEEQARPKSYLYDGQTSRQVASPPSRGETSYTEPDDPYSDPFNQLSGYMKQAGYPPQTNHPSSARYNPYKEMGYYGYTYGGPPTGSHLRQSSYQPVADQGQPGQVEETGQGRGSGQGSGQGSSCDTTQWGDWSQCSTDCGTGTMTRNRHYTSPSSSSCSAELTSTKQCEEASGCSRTAPNTTSRRPSPRRRMRTTTPPPQTSTARLLRKPTATKRPDRQRSSQTDRPGRMTRPQAQVLKRRRLKSGDPQCAVALWTDWSPCSVTCGQGYRLRTRVYTVPFVPNRVCDNARLTQKQDCRMATCWNSDYYSGHDDTMTSSDPRTQAQPRQGFCVMEPAPGVCKSSSIQQWFYNATESSCARFMYTGCGGNKNNFGTEAECLGACQPQGSRRTDRFRGLQPQSLVREEEFLQRDEPARPQDCSVTQWNTWSPCSSSCGRGWEERERSVVTSPELGGRPCPRKLLKRRRCREEVPCPASPPAWYQSNWRMLEDRQVDN